MPLTGAIIYRDLEQGSEEWLSVRAGIPTASEFKSVLAKGEGKTRRAYMLRLAGERITGVAAETYENGHMIRGRVMESEARDAFALQSLELIERVGFVRNGDVGCSPDSLLGDDGVLEIKTKLPGLLIETILRGDMPPEHRPQCQGSLLVTERERVTIACFWPGMPLFVHEERRDEKYIANLAGEIARFNDELALVVEQVRAYGQAPKEVLREQLERSVK